jgi:hypothetical protein
MNAFSALWGGVATGLFFLLARQVLQMVVPASWPAACSRVLALLAAALVAVSPTFWSQAVVAEVYTLNAALLIGVLLALTRWAVHGGTGALYLAALLFGLSLAHHRTTLLWAPAIAAFLWLSSRQRAGALRPALGPRGIAVLALLVLAPVLLYLVIPLRAAVTPYRSIQVGPDQVLELYRPTLTAFLNHVTGRDFESEFRTPIAALSRAAPSLRLLADEITWIGVLLGIVGVAWLARCSRPLSALTGLSFMALLLFNLFYSIGDIAAYYIPLFALWALWIACGAAGIATAAGAIVRRRGAETRASTPHPIVLVSCLLALLLPLHLLRSGFARIDQGRNTTARDAWEATLARPIPPGAILVTNDRDEMMPLWYMQYVEGRRPDLTGLFPLIQPAAAWRDVGATVESALRSGRPVLLIKEMPGLDVRFRLEPDAGLVRVLGAAAERPPDRLTDALFGDAATGDALRLAGFDLGIGSPAPGQRGTVALHWQPLRRLNSDYTTFVHLVNADGRVIGASDHRPGGVYYPTSLWKPGETLLDTHTLTMDADLGRPPYAVEVGVYTGEGELRRLGQPQRIGVIGGPRPPDAIPADLAHRLDADFGGQIALRGYDSAVQPDGLVLRLYWQALGAPTADYTVFVHVLDRGGKIVAQHDGQPLGGALPMRAWSPGEIVADAVSIPMAQTLAPGAYRLIAGLYNAATGARLPVAGGGAGPADIVLLDEVQWPARP